MGIRIIFATNNEGKMNEISTILSDQGLPVFSMKEVGLELDIVEDGTTFEENALIKAQAVAARFPEDIILADDSGIEVDYLDKAPGVYSARFAGRDTPYEKKNQMIIDKLEGVPDIQRSARFVCVIAAVFPDGTKKLTRGTIEGQIAYKISGQGGFGYDPIFYVPKYGITTAEMSAELKNTLSHRGIALREMKKVIDEKMKLK